MDCSWNRTHNSRNTSVNKITIIASSLGRTRYAFYGEEVFLAMEDFKCSGRATHNTRPASDWESKADERRRKLDRTFPKTRRAKGIHLDRASIIAKYHQIYLEGKFPFGIPENYIRPSTVVAIMQIRGERIGTNSV